jgi:hypothetical protein
MQQANNLLHMFVCAFVQQANSLPNIAKKHLHAFLGGDPSVAKDAPSGRRHLIVVNVFYKK